MGSQEDRALELVVFKLNEGVSRELAYDAEGDRWIDLVWWRSMEDARAAANLAMSSESCAPMFGLIDMESTLMVHGEPVIAPVS